MKAVLLSGDLMVVSRISGAAAQTGAVVRAANNASQAIEACESEAAELLVIDLATPAVDLTALGGQLRASRCPSMRIVAFGPHVHEDKLAAAREAGCDLVVSRGQFFSQVDAIFSG
jgi:DNA-binding NarL/FixJ family response regulator